MTEDEKYMARCIQLAYNGLTRVQTNPMVGAVIVRDGRIIGEGYHARFGEGHAEVNAVRSVKDPSLLPQSTIYVSLEPCAHYGKTPPCAQLLIDKRIPRVVVGCQDPFAQVAGRGIRMLREAGAEITVGVLEAECRRLLRYFATYQLERRPYVTLKWAESADGFIDVLREGGSPVVLSTPLTSLLVHKRRAEANAILVGTNTALLDNPTLTVRHWAGASPLRVVIDRTLRLPQTLRLFSDGLPTLCFTLKERESNASVTYVTLESDRPLLPQLLRELHRRGIQRLLVEGGARLLQAFIDDGLWDEAYAEHASIRLGSGVAAPRINRAALNIETHFGVPIFHWQRAE